MFVYNTILLKILVLRDLLYVNFIFLGDGIANEVKLEAREFYTQAKEFLKKNKLLQEAPEELKRQYEELEKLASPICTTDKS